MTEEEKLRECFKLLFTTIFDPPQYDHEKDDTYIEDDCYRRLYLGRCNEMREYIEELFE